MMTKRIFSALLAAALSLSLLAGCGSTSGSTASALPPSSDNSMVPVSTEEMIRFDNRFIFYISPFTVFLCFNCASLIRSLPLHVQASAGLKILCKIFPKENLFLLTTFFF